MSPQPSICRPDEFLIRRILHCPNCQRRRRFAVREAAWYGFTATCCACGDSWSDGERQMRPTRRGWRAEASAAARRTWAAAGTFDQAAHHEWLRRQIGAAS